MSDIECDDLRRAALKEHVGEATRRGADVECLASAGVDGEHIERVRELHAPAAHIRVIGSGKADRRRLVDGGTGLGHHLIVDRHLSGEDDGARPLTRGRQAAFDEQEVEPFL